MKRKSSYLNDPPVVSSLSEANLLIEELWEKLRDYETRMGTSSRNSSRASSADTPQVRGERKKLKSLVAEIRLALSQVTRGIKEQ